MKKRIMYVLMVIFLIMFAYSSIQIIQWYKDNKENEEELSKISEAVLIEQGEEKENKYIVDFAKLKEQNSDCVGYLKVNSTNIDYSVVQGIDNAYYLTHSFNRNHNGAGWIFADYRNKIDGTDKNLIVYGHNRRDGSMFGSLNNALNKEWYENEENRKIIFITETDNSEYEIFSIYKVKEEEYYIKTDFNDEEFGKFIRTVKNRSIADFGVEVNHEDSILTLSTCDNDNNYRVVVHAKKVKLKPEL